MWLHNALILLREVAALRFIGVVVGLTLNIVVIALNLIHVVDVW